MKTFHFSENSPPRLHLWFLCILTLLSQRHRNALLLPVHGSSVDSGGVGFRGPGWSGVPEMVPGTEGRGHSPGGGFVGGWDCRPGGGASRRLLPKLERRSGRGREALAESGLGVVCRPREVLERGASSPGGPRGWGPGGGWWEETRGEPSTCANAPPSRLRGTWNLGRVTWF